MHWVDSNHRPSDYQARVRSTTPQCSHFTDRIVILTTISYSYTHRDINDDESGPPAPGVGLSHGVQEEHGAEDAYSDGHRLEGGRLVFIV